MTIESLNELAEGAIDSKNTIPGEILFFRGNSTASESLKKLKNHNFKIGYSFSLTLDDNEYTRVIAYNPKNDIFRAWMGPDILEDGTISDTFPLVSATFFAQLYMPRYDKDGKLRLYKEDFKKGVRQAGHGKKMFSDLAHLENIDDVSFYGEFLPILEHPEVEFNRRFQMLQNPSIDRTFYSDVAFICNVYRFDETYELLDDGLKEIYRTLFENREKRFCMEIIKAFENDGVVEEVLSTLNLDMVLLSEIFERQGFVLPCITSLPSKEYSILSSLKAFMSRSKHEKTLTRHYKKSSLFKSL